MFKKLTLLFVVLLATNNLDAQTIHTRYASASHATISSSYDTPGNIIYPTGYTRYNSKTPVIFVHGISDKASSSWEANIQAVKDYHLNAAFVQLYSFGSTTTNGKLLKRMIDQVAAHYGCKTVSIVAHSKGGLDTEKALYYRGPYNNSLPSFGYLKVDAVYTFSSPLKGARVADTGAYLSVIPGWTGFLSFVAMSTTGGWSLTSGHVNSARNWEDNWNIYGTFYNYYNQNGRYYNRQNLRKDNTTRWWAHQSNDYWYQNKWYYKYVGNVYHKTVGAYMDAYWEWDWFNSGWRNWHSSNDGFISEYRAKRNVINNSSPSYTPGAGDHNYRTSRNANHTSLWEAGENHFRREAAPYLHYGLYNGANRMANTTPKTPVDLTAPANKKDEVAAPVFKVLASNGNLYTSTTGKTEFIVEEDNAEIGMLLYTKNPIQEVVLTNANGKKYAFNTLKSQKDEYSEAQVNAITLTDLPKGVYTLKAGNDMFYALANSDDYKSSFAVNLNFDESKGYNGETIQVSLGNKDTDLNYDALSLKATVTLLSEDGENHVKSGTVKPRVISFKESENEVGLYNTTFENLIPGAVYSLRIEAKIKEGDVLLSRNVINTFYVHKDMEMKTVTDGGKIIKEEVLDDNSLMFPNPTTDMVTIRQDFGTNTTVSIMNTQGKVLHTFEGSAKETRFSTKSLGLNAGVYIVKIQSNTKTVVKKLIVK